MYISGSSQRAAVRCTRTRAQVGLEAVKRDRLIEVPAGLAANTQTKFRGVGVPKTMWPLKLRSKLLVFSHYLAARLQIP